MSKSKYDLLKTNIVCVDVNSARTLPRVATVDAPDSVTQQGLVYSLFAAYVHPVDMLIYALPLLRFLPSEIAPGFHTCNVE